MNGSEFVSMSAQDQLSKMHEQETVRRNLEALTSMWKALNDDRVRKGVFSDPDLAKSIAEKIHEHLKLLVVN
jgi:hypothetical protein